MTDHVENSTTVEDKPPTVDPALQDKYLRLAAEFENYKKRIKREQERNLQRERERVLKDWLEIADSLDRAVSMTVSSDEVWRQGTENILGQVRTVLDRWGLTRIDPLGEAFDSRLHEAIAAIPDPNRPNGTVLSTERLGYVFKDGTVLRPARVVVVKNP